MKFINKTTLLAGAIVFLLSSNFMMMNRLDSLQNNMSMINSQMNSLSAQLGDLRSDFHNLNQREKLIREHSYDITNSKDYENANVKVNVSLNKLDTGSNVLFMYRDFQTPNAEWQIKELDNQAGLDFTTELDLSYDGNYETQLVIEKGSEKLSERMRAIELKNKLSNRIEMSARPKTASSNGNLFYEVSVQNNYNEGEDLKLKSINCYIYYNDKLVHKVDVMDKGEKRDLRQAPVELWSFSENIKIDEMVSKKDDFMEPLVIMLEVVDKIGKKYEYKYGERF